MNAAATLIFLGAVFIPDGICNISTGREPDLYCMGHGIMNCTCQPGFTGVSCDQRINYCEQKIDGGENVTITDVCSTHGECENTVAGAICNCDQGFEGVLCQSTNNITMVDSRRCALYSTNETEEQNLIVGCPQNQRCLADNLDCAFQTCQFPIGWCVLKPRAREHSRRYTIQEYLVHQPSTVLTNANASHHCSYHGQPHCICDYGYTGPNCATGILEIDFCTGVIDGMESRPMTGDVCGEHGWCNSTLEGFKCLCHKGYTGRFCETALTDEAYCGGRCVLGSSNSSLLCPPDQRCLSDNLDCAFGNCSDAIGWCLPIDTNQISTSPPISTSTAPQHTTLITTACPPMVCYNGGTVTGSCTCQCYDGFKGTQCELPDTTQCGNQSISVTNGTGSLVVQSYYTNANMLCIYNLDSLCGSMIDLTIVGPMGPTSDLLIYSTQDPALFDAHKVSNITSGFCSPLTVSVPTNQAAVVWSTRSYPDTFTIFYTAVAVDLCHPTNPCGVNGSCANNCTSPYGYYCTCPSGWHGAGHGPCTAPTACDMITCQNGASCSSTDQTHFTCHCTSGFTGQYCQTPISTTLLPTAPTSTSIPTPTPT